MNLSIVVQLWKDLSLYYRREEKEAAGEADPLENLPPSQMGDRVAGRREAPVELDEWS